MCLPISPSARSLYNFFHSSTDKYIITASNASIKNPSHQRKNIDIALSSVICANLSIWEPIAGNIHVRRWVAKYGINITPAAIPANFIIFISRLLLCFLFFNFYPFYNLFILIQFLVPPYLYHISIPVYVNNIFLL